MILAVIDPVKLSASCLLCWAKGAWTDHRETMDELMAETSAHLDLVHHRVLVSQQNLRGKIWIIGPRQGWTGDLPDFVHEETR